MTPPPSMSQQSFETNEGSIREFVSRLMTSILDASQSSRKSAGQTIEESKAERAKSQNKNFQPFPRLDQVLDLGIISDCQVNSIMPAQALPNLDKSLAGYLQNQGVSWIKECDESAESTGTALFLDKVWVGAKFQIPVEADSSGTSSAKWYYVYAEGFRSKDRKHKQIEFSVYGLVDAAIET